MSYESFSEYGPASRDRATAPATKDGEIPTGAQRAICAVMAVLGLFCAAACFTCAVKPFGNNPPPKEVCWIGGAVFVCIAIALGAVALYYRGTPAERAEADRRLDRVAALGRPTTTDTSAARDSATAPKPIGTRVRTRRNPVTDLMGVAALLGILIGPAIGYATYQRQKVLQSGKPEPRVLPVTDLGRNGPGDNIHVKITDFTFGKKYALHTRKGSWADICIPAFPKDKAEDPRSLQLVVRTSRVRDEKELNDFIKRSEIEGVVVNSIYDWENDKEYMQGAYPGADTSAIWVVQESYTFPTESEIKTMYTISSAIVGVAVFCGAGALIRRFV